MSAHSGKGLFHNIGWQSVAMLTRLVIMIATLAILARIGDAEVMGLYGIAWVAVAIGFAIVQSGTAQSLIVVEEMRPAHISAAHALTLGLSAAVALLLVMGAPLFARMYDNEAVIRAYRLAAIFVLVMPLGAVDMALAQKALEFRLIAKVQTLASLGAGATAIGLGYFLDPLVGLFAMQALIGPFQYLVFRLMGRQLALSWFGRAELAELWYVGIHLSFNSLTSVLMRNLPQVLVALFLPLESVGVFTLARRIVEIIGTQIGGVVNQVVYPTFARIHNNTSKIGEVVVITSRLTAMLMLIPLVFLGVAPGSFLALYAGEAWRSGGPVLAFLLLMQAGFAAGQNIFPTFQAIGKPSVAWKWNLSLTTLQAGLIFVFPHTLTAAAMAMAISTLIMPAAGWLLSRALGFAFLDWLSGIAIAVLPGIACAVAGNFVFEQINPGDGKGPEILAFVLVGGIATLTYLVLMIRVDPTLRRAIQRSEKTP